MPSLVEVGGKLIVVVLADAPTFVAALGSICSFGHVSEELEVTKAGTAVVRAVGTQGQASKEGIPPGIHARPRCVMEVGYSWEAVAGGTHGEPSAVHVKGSVTRYWHEWFEEGVAHAAPLGSPEAAVVARKCGQ